MLPCGVYKIGESKYIESGIDKNSGLFESNLIKDKIAQAYGYLKINIDLNINLSKEHDAITCDKLIIIGGTPTHLDYFYLTNIKANKKIFVMTDIDTLKTCKEFIDTCDIVLTQTTIFLEEINKPQAYSYVPELFFDENVNPNIHLKSDNVLFAGSIDGREDKYLNYFYDAKKCEVRDKVVIIPKINNGVDYRLQYSEYIKLQKLFKYTLICITEECRKNGWITSRFVEAINLNVIPFVDFEYDVMNHFVADDSLLRVKNYTSLINAINILKELNITNSILKKYRKRFAQDNKKFIKIVKEV